MQLYKHYYEREMMNPGDNPPVGIVLGSDTDSAIVKYTLNEHERNLFAVKYHREGRPHGQLRRGRRAPAAPRVLSAHPPSRRLCLEETSFEEKRMTIKLSTFFCHGVRPHGKCEAAIRYALRIKLAMAQTNNKLSTLFLPWGLTPWQR